jgi:glycosyltransferase involved in cell wall biosynthesis
MDHHPLFSIIIPTYNRPDRLRQCLTSVSRLDYPTHDFELIVVDDGSAQDLREVVNDFAGQLDVKYLRQNNAGPASARNLGARHAQGSYLVFTDDDCRFAPNWLSLMAAQLARTPDQLLGGKTINVLKDNIFSSTSQFLVDIVYEHYNKDPKDGRFFASNNMLVPAAAYREIGGFPDDFPCAGGEDRELCDRWRWKGYKMRYVPEAVIYHAHHLSLSKYCKQHFNYGIGAFYFHQVRKKRQSGTMVQEMNFHTNLNNWLFAPFTRGEKHPVSMFFLLMLWQVANLAGFVWAAYAGKGLKSGRHIA